MKYALICLILTFLSACDRPVKYYTAISCDRDECKQLVGFPDLEDCFGLLDSLHDLYKTRGDLPAKITFCKDENGKKMP